MKLTVVSSTNDSAHPVNDRQTLADMSKLLESMRKGPILKPRLEKIGDKTKETAPPFITQLWEFMQVNLEREHLYHWPMTPLYCCFGRIM